MKLGKQTENKTDAWKLIVRKMKAKKERTLRPRKATVNK